MSRKRLNELLPAKAALHGDEVEWRLTCSTDHPPRCLAVVLLLLFSTVCAGFLPAAGLEPSECHRVILSKPILWATTGAWTEDGTALLVADVLREEVLRISVRGEVTATLTGEVASATGALPHPLRLPMAIHTVDGGYLLEEDAALQIFRLNQYLKVSGSMPVKRTMGTVEELDGEADLMAVYRWSPMGEGILAFGDIEGPGGKWESAFVYFDEIGRHQVFHGVPIGDPIRTHYIRSSAYLAALGDVGYILLMDQGSARIGEVRVGVDGIRQLEAFPEDFRASPQLARPERAAAPRRATAFYRSLERSTMAAGLYAWDDHLFLLGRKPLVNGETAWWLIKLDPRDASAKSQVRLPTGASHLTVVPGDTWWAFIQKGPVQGVGETNAPYMDAFSFVLVPAAWLEVSDPRSLESGVEMALPAIPLKLDEQVAIESARFSETAQ